MNALYFQAKVAQNAIKSGKCPAFNAKMWCNKKLKKEGDNKTKEKIMS